MLTMLAATAMAGMATQAWTARWITTESADDPVRQAQWIWAATPAAQRPTAKDAPAGTASFHLEFDLPAAPREATLRIAADNEAEARVNGSPVGGTKSYSSLTRIDLTKHLKAGTNRIDIRATNAPGVPGGNPGGFVGIVQVLDAEGRQHLFPTGPGWKAEGGELVVLGPLDMAPWRLRGETAPPPRFRKEFELSKPFKRAVVRVIGLGDFELRLNGRKVGQTVFDQPWSQYDKAIYWREFDVTRLLREGGNAFGVQLGNSFWSVAAPPPGRYAKGDAMPDFSEGQTYLLRLQCDVEFADGTRQTIETDESWSTTSDGPLLFSHIFAGEDVDARKEQPGWDKPGFGGEGWTPARLGRNPGAELRAQFWPGVEVRERFKPVRWIEREPGVWSAVFPQNCSGVVETKLRGRAGQTVTLKPSEVMTPEGAVQQLNLWGGACSYSYTLRGGRSETWRWTFTYHGFQYVEVRGAVPAGKPNPLGLPVVEDITLLHTRTANPTAGSFESSSALYNRVHRLVDWAMRSNMSHVMTDCPHREKLGWLECSYLLAPTFSYLYDARDWFRKIAADIRDTQMEDGRIRTLAPWFLLRPPDDPYAYTVEWGAAGVFLPWHLYEWYGDRETLAKAFESMKRFTDHVGTLAKDGIAPGALGDWYDYGHGQGPGPSRFTPQDLSATATWAMCADTCAKSARVLGMTLEAERYEALRETIRRSFLAKFYDPSTKTVRHHGSPQAGASMALAAGLIPESDREAVLKTVLDDLERRDWQQTPGDVGHVYFIRALASMGRSDLLHKVYSRTGLGSYGGILAKGLTTMPETWDAITVGSNSLNHCMLGHVVEWFHGWVLGIRQAPGSVGWERVLIAPEPGDLQSAKGELRTPKGLVKVAWTRGREFVCEVTVPAGSAARFRTPMRGRITVDGGLLPRGTTEADLPPGRHRILVRP